MGGDRLSDLILVSSESKFVNSLDKEKLIKIAPLEIIELFCSYFDLKHVILSIVWMNFFFKYSKFFEKSI